MGDKYILTENRRIVNGVPVYEIQAVKDFETVERKKIKSGTSGGYVEGYRNLSQDGKSWVADGAIVMDNATVNEDAVVRDAAMITGEARVYGSARILDKATVSGDAKVHGKTVVQNVARIDGHSEINGEVYIRDHVIITGGSYITGFVSIEGRVRMIDSSLTHGAKVVGKSLIRNCTLTGSHVIGDCKLTNVRTGVNRVTITNSVITCDIMLMNYYDIVNANIQHTSDYFVSPYFFAYNRNDGDITFIFDGGWYDTHKRLSEYDEYIAGYKDNLQAFFKDIKPIVVRYLKGEYHNE